MNQLKGFITVLILCTLSFYAQSSVENIQINNKQRILIAPEGDHYQWYFNGLKMDQVNTADINIEQSGTYEVIFTNKSGNLESKEITVSVTTAGIKKIYIISDSTAANYGSNYYPQTGWGQILWNYFNNSKVEVINNARGGRSSRSYFEEGLWAGVINLVDSGDYVFIQFGHNDRDWSKAERFTDTAQFKDFMRLYVDETRQKGATPVLISPMIMNAYNGSGLRNVFTEGSNDYRGAMLQVANEEDATFIDLNMKSYDRVKEVGQDYATYFWYFTLKSGEYSNYASGHNDFTHFQEMGALEMANLIREGIVESAGEPGMDLLIDALNPLYEVKIDKSEGLEGTYTFSGKYPAGIKFTQKFYSSNHLNFYNWTDSLDNEITKTNVVISTLDAKDYYFKANGIDCEGTINGSAILDNCNVCTGGTTGNESCYRSFQSETACEQDGSKNTSVYFNKTKSYLNTKAYNKPGVTYALTAKTEGTFNIGIVYGNNAPDEKLNIYVDDSLIIEGVELKNTMEWNISKVEVNLKEGRNFMRIESQAGGGIYFDEIVVYNADIFPASCFVTKVNKVSDEKQQVAYPNPFKESIFLDVKSKTSYKIIGISGNVFESGVLYSAKKIGSNLECGIYLLETESNGIKNIQKIQKVQ